MKRSDILPTELGDWLRGLPTEDLRHRLRLLIAERTAKAGLPLDASSLAANVEALDERYFASHEEGKEEEAMRLFKHARLLSAQRFFVAGEVEEAIYEFIHSLDDATPESAITILQKPIQSPQRNAGSRPSSGGSPESETPSSLGPRG